jgi:SAM-dependent methyltransferase
METMKHKWVIEDDGRPSQGQQLFWEREHLAKDYETTFSVGEDEEVMERVVDAVLEADSCQDILVAGCGSRTDLQRQLLDRAPALTEVVATDFAPVVAKAAGRFSHPRLTYASLEQASGWRRRFDVVVAVNVLVMEGDLENRSLLREWSAMLREGGTFVGLLPMLFCGIDLALLSGRDDLWSCLDLDRSSWHERLQGIRQIEYSPLRLRRVLAETGLRLDDLRIVFLAGPSSRAQARIHYELDDEDLLVYEQLVVASRR